MSLARYVVPVISFGGLFWPASWWWLCRSLWCWLTRILLQILSLVLGKGTPMFLFKVWMNSIIVKQYQHITQPAPTKKGICFYLAQTQGFITSKILSPPFKIWGVLFLSPHELAQILANILPPYIYGYQRLCIPFIFPIFCNIFIICCYVKFFPLTYGDFTLYIYFVIISPPFFFLSFYFIYFNLSLLSSTGTVIFFPSSLGGHVFPTPI